MNYYCDGCKEFVDEDHIVDEDHRCQQWGTVYMIPEEAFELYRSVNNLTKKTNPNQQYKPIPTEWTNDWAECRAVDADGKLWEYEFRPDITSTERCWNYHLGRGSSVSEGHDPTNWKNSLEQRTRKMRHMTPLEAFEFLAEGHEGKPRVWRHKVNGETVWATAVSFGDGLEAEDLVYANLSDRDGDTLIWREFPLVEDKA